MIINIIIGFIIPWIFGIVLYYKDKFILLTIAPIVAAISLCINSLGIYLEYWALTPINLYNVSAIPVDLGAYPVLAAYMIFHIRKTKFHHSTVIFSFTFLTTFIEYLGLLSGKVVYYNGWNIGFTFLSYLVPYILTYTYYTHLKRLGVYKLTASILKNL